MCTLTWKPLADGYALFFNRDEQRSRPAPRPPEIYVREGIRFIAPIDPQGGGTWLATNESGLTLAILNHYPPTPVSGCGATISRGVLTLAAAATGTVGEAVERLAAMKFDACAPFRWVAVDASTTHLAIWDGARMLHRSLAVGGEMLTSSSVRSEETENLRQASLRARLGSVRDANIRAIEAFHRHRDAGDPALGANMSRPDACTQSFSYVRFMPHETVFAYETADGDITLHRLEPYLPPAQARAG